MIVFCPNCGTQNEGVAGATARCSACASAFEVPFESASPPRVPVAAAPVAPPPPSFSVPGAQVFAPTRPGKVATNTLAIASLVAGILCCIPFAPLLAIGFGVAGVKQIDAAPNSQGGRGLAIAGIIIGAIFAVLQVLGLIGSLVKR